MPTNRSIRISADFLRKRYPQLADASDVEIAQLAHQALAPDLEYRKFETTFLGEPRPVKELGRGIARGARAIKGGWDFLAGGLAGAAGDTASRDESFTSYEDNLNAANRIAPRLRASDIRSLRDAAAWGAGVVGGAVPVLMSGGVGGAGAVGAVGGFASVPGAASTVDYLIPRASSSRKALAAGGIVMVNGVGDAFIPMRILSRIAQPRLGGIPRDMALGAAVGAATPVAENAIAAGTATANPGALFGASHPHKQD